MAEAHRSPQTALELPPDQKVAGEFDGAENIFFIRVRLGEGAMLRGELSAARAVDSSLAVLSGPATVLSETDDYGSSIAEEIFPVYLAAGENFIRIRGKGGEHSAFTFFYRTFKAPSDVEREPNNSPETANAVQALHAAGFYGPGMNGRERDCFLKERDASDPGMASVKLTGVEGISSSLVIFDAGQKEILRQEGAAGSPVTAGPFNFTGSRIYACVAALTAEKKASRDYYDLTFAFGEATQKTEVEPNNTAATATAIRDDLIEGAFAAFGDTDFFTYRNRRDYPVSLHAELEIRSGGTEVLFTAQRPGQGLLQFENSAPRGEVAENIRLDAGETLTLGVKQRSKLRKKNFKPTEYTLKLQETQASDENETEPNATAATADTLVDLTQKWGFINPVGDNDYYRIKIDAPAERVLSFESKIDCKLRIEHLRGAKTLANQGGSGTFRYKAAFEKDDVIRLQCLGQKANPAERAYRLALGEP